MFFALHPRTHPDERLTKWIEISHFCCPILSDVLHSRLSSSHISNPNHHRSQLAFLRRRRLPRALPRRSHTISYSITSQWMGVEGIRKPLISLMKMTNMKISWHGGTFQFSVASPLREEIFGSSTGKRIMFCWLWKHNNVSPLSCHLIISRNWKAKKCSKTSFIHLNLCRKREASRGKGQNAASAHFTSKNHFTHAAREKNIRKYSSLNDVSQRKS